MIGRPSASAAVAARSCVSTTPDHDVAAGIAQPTALFEHLVGLAHAGRGAEQHPQAAPLHLSILPLSLSALEGVEREVELQHVDPRLAEEPEVPCLNPRLHEVAHGLLVEAARLGDPVDLEQRVRRADVRVEARTPTPSRRPPGSR